MHVGILVAIAALQWGRFNPEFVALFTPLEFRYSQGEVQDELIRYRLFIPEQGTPTERMPLIVWLHGRGEAGAGNLNQLRWLDHLIFADPWDRRDYPFFVLAVNCAPDNPLWTRTAEAQGFDMIDVVRAILDKTLQEYPIDRQRVYLSGVSSGGAGCWEFARRYPEYFAAVAPLASGGGTQNMEKLVDIPIWAFHCSRDQPSIEGARRTVEALKRAGGNVHLTEVDSASHDAWNPAFNDYHLLDWLLLQRRGELSPPPGTVSLSTRLEILTKGWKWWQVLVQIGIPVLIVAAGWQAVRARRRWLSAEQDGKHPRPDQTGSCSRFL